MNVNDFTALLNRTIFESNLSITGEAVAYVVGALVLVAYAIGSVRIARGAKRRAVARVAGARVRAVEPDFVNEAIYWCMAPPATIFWLLAPAIALYHVLRVGGKAAWWLVPKNLWRLLTVLNRAVEGKPSGRQIPHDIKDRPPF